ncbi:Holliday junction DNA helicase RuvA [Mycoplasma sp. NEAQ87857]|uniref:Holliday junction branch migration protein RuvA n=1 Tax=Mycoplasma sp. NEAQ87857 TaxID=2683967 RepID=UPI00131827B4|nr:Holliday junction branch migration protein RuvA [Mycoplasma sp. NEAQ87857]QGZ97272.1 Holliday junction DNA helicase RuvA [Mycoplasma sp. NEAQ87857]
MILYRKGKITYINKNFITFDTYATGYSVYVADANRFNVSAPEDKNITLYWYEDDQRVCGFKDYKERLLFIDLISIKNIGVKTAMVILEQGWEKIANYIAKKDIKTLSSIQYIDEKTASLICLELSSKWSNILKNSATNGEVFNEAKIFQ